MCRLCIVQYDSSLFDLLGESYQQAPHVRTHPPVAAGSQDRDQEGGPLQEPPHLLTPEARDTAEGSAVQASDTAENNVKVKDVSNVTQKNLKERTLGQNKNSSKRSGKL